jgi:tRNA (guanine-N7-)-methyltransferase
MPGKLQKFAEVEAFPNCFAFHFMELQNGFKMRGKWHEEFFRNDHPLIIELGCGKGEYTVGLARAHRNRNYIGVDIKGNRIWTGARQALDEQLTNTAFLRTRIDFIDHCFAPSEVSEIWITFPDPQPQKNRARKRLTHPMFINRYRKFLKAGGLVHLKTDSTSLYEYTLEVIRQEKLNLHFNTSDLYLNCPAGRKELTTIKTYYENLFASKGEKIKYVCFSLG